VRETQLGPDHPDCIATRHNIAELYIQWANPEKAQEYLQKNIEVMEARNEKDKRFREENPDKQKENTYF
jgi:hypothetical protein